jgi:hypothetical protein
MAMTPKQSDADQRIEQLILLTERLTDCTERECEILRLKRPRDMAPVHEEKSKIAAAYAREIAQLRRDKMLPAAARPELAAKLKDTTARFRAALDELSRHLGRVRRISEGMIRAIADEMQSKDASPVGYGESAAPPSRAPKPATLALNQVV